MHTLEAKGVDLIISLKFLWSSDTIILRNLLAFLNLMLHNKNCVYTALLPSCQRCYEHHGYNVFIPNQGK